MDENDKLAGGQPEEEVLETQDTAGVENLTQAAEEPTEDAPALAAVDTQAANEGEETEEEQLEDTPEEGGKRKKRVGRYKYHIEAPTYYNLLMELEVLNGRERKNRNTAIVFLVLALISAVDAGLRPGNYLALLAAAVLIMVGFMMKNQSRKSAKRSVKAVPDGFSLAVEVSSKGLKVQQSGQNGTILPYEGIRMVYDHDGYLYIVTGDRTSMYMPKDKANHNYMAIEQKLREVKKDKYRIV